MATPETLDNRYHIIKILADGGMGVTYLAEDTRMPSPRRCVIKQLKPVQSNPEKEALVRDRFKREAAVLEGLGAENEQIPKFYAYFVEDGKYYLVQEWIEGQTLKERCKQQGPMPEAAVKDVLCSLLKVLKFIHGQGMIHRDIKPDNIILRSADDQPVLIDFGIVKESVAPTLDEGSSLVYTIAVGTPWYMSAEQAAGRPVFASDLYSLGLTAIYMLTGIEPQKLRFEHVNSRFRFIWRDEVQINPLLADALDKAIQYLPTDRFSSAEEMLSCLNAVQIDTEKRGPYHSAPIESAATIEHRASLGKVQIITLSLFIMSILGLSIYIGWQQSQPDGTNSPNTYPDLPNS